MTVFRRRQGVASSDILLQQVAKRGGKTPPAQSIFGLSDRTFSFLGKFRPFREKMSYLCPKCDRRVRATARISNAASFGDIASQREVSAFQTRKPGDTGKGVSHLWVRLVSGRTTFKASSLLLDKNVQKPQALISAGIYGFQIHLPAIMRFQRP